MVRPGNAFAQYFISATIFALAFFLSSLLSPRQVAGKDIFVQILVLNRRGDTTDRLTDGDHIQLQARLESRILRPMRVVFYLEPDLRGEPVAECWLAWGEKQCTSPLVSSLGWHWHQGNAANQRFIFAFADGKQAGISQPLSISPRPVVMVHGFSSSWEAWANYLGPEGFLASAGIPGFAVGDGQVEGVMNTGDIGNPTARTNTIDENAAILGDYISQVKAATGAEQVDLLAHSMGGLISRDYIGRVMENRDVAQLIMLGSPMAGTDCANLPASLGFYLPATLELRPNYVERIFNQQVTRRHGIQFYALAGVPIVDSLKSPCTSVPTDLAVSLDSVSAIPLNVAQLPILHIDLNTSKEVFDQFVLPLLQKPADQFIDSPDAQGLPVNLPQEQFTQVFTGHVDRAGSQQVTIPIDAGVTVASFALFEATHTLTVTVQGASGNVINLDPVKNGLIQVDDPATMVYLGYGFNNPKPGAWVVTLRATEKTPGQGTDYAITARFQGGAVFQAQADPLLPEIDQQVILSAQLVADDQALAVIHVNARVVAPNGSEQFLDLSPGAAGYQVTWQPHMTGLYAVDVVATAQNPEGTGIQRASFLTVDVQPPRQITSRSVILILAGCGLILLASIILGALIYILLRSKRSRSEAG